MIEEKNKRKNKVIKGIALLGLFLMVFGISYALFQITLNGKKTNKITTGKFDLLITNPGETSLETEGFGINEETVVPISSTEGMETTPYEFDLYNPGDYPVKYTLYFRVPNNIDNIPSDKIKYNLKRKDTGLILSSFAANGVELDDNHSEEDDPGVEALRNIMSSLLLSDVYDKEETEEGITYKLYKMDLGVIGPKQRQQYEYRMWIFYGANTEINDKSLEGKMKVFGEQVGTGDAYPLETIVLEPTEMESNLAIQSTASLYSDKSIRINSDRRLLNDKEDYILMNWAYDLEENMPIIRERGISWAQNYFGDAYSEYEAHIIENTSSWYNFLNTFINEESPNYGLEESLYAEIGEYVEDNMSRMQYGTKFSSNYNGTLYLDMECSYLNNDNNPVTNLVVKNLFISNKIDRIRYEAFSYNQELETITFLDYENADDMIFDLSALRSLSNLKEITLPSNLKTISSATIDSDIKANITLKIRAQKANVTYNQSDLEGFKAVEWLNN